MSGDAHPVPTGSRLRGWLRDAAIVAALIGAWLLMTLVVLPRLGFET